MHVLIAGGTGFIGRALSEYLLNQGHQVTLLGRSEKKMRSVLTSSLSNRIHHITWENFAPKAEDILAGTHWLINLTGANIGAGRWTNIRKQKILESRIETTQYLAKVCASLGEQSPVFFNASAVGVYGLGASDKSLDEDTAIDFDQYQDFLAEIGRKWEMACKEAELAGVRTLKLRLGVVLGDGGVLQKLTPIYRAGLGGKIGNGKQAFPWIAIEDALRAMEFIFEHTEISGPINLVAPNHTTQLELAKAMGKALKRPTFLPTPAWMLKLIYGQMAEELLLKGNHVTPKRLQQADFTFLHTNLDHALTSIFNPDKDNNEEQKPEPNPEHDVHTPLPL